MDIATDVLEGLTTNADEDKISVVIDSMLSNAVSYSKPPRKIRIMYISAPHDPMHQLAIQDNGIRITSTQLDEIFEPFQMPNPSQASKRYERNGLSISIAKKYVQMHGVLFPWTAL